MKVDGRCHCGSISFSAEVDPARTNICHCTDCQMQTGTTFRASVLAPRENFVLKGAPKLYRKTAESGGIRVQAFCGECGTPIYSTTDEPAPPAYNLRLGTLRQRAELIPTVQYWCRSAMPWLPALPGARLDRQEGWTGR